VYGVASGNNYKKMNYKAGIIRLVTLLFSIKLSDYGAPIVSKLSLHSICKRFTGIINLPPHLNRNRKPVSAT